MQNGEVKQVINFSAGPAKLPEMVSEFIFQPDSTKSMFIFRFVFINI